MKNLGGTNLPKYIKSEAKLEQFKDKKTIDLNINLNSPIRKRTKASNSESPYRKMFTNLNNECSRN